ncbi:MAG: glycosyltransferase family 4 protein [Candidatus Liptonbacteria bacterium]|nr:glycosyltransferase family 4 protein [Candidatus Liptonbacteria bacterium]
MSEPIIKLVYAHNSLTERGGAERKMLLLAKHFAAVPGVNLEIMVHGLNPDKTFKEYLTGYPVRVFPASNPIAKYFALRRMGRAAQAADLIHAHNHPGHVAAVFAKRLQRKPILWFCNEPMLYLEGTKRRTSLWKLFLVRLFEKLILPQIDQIVSNSENTRRNIKQYLKRDSVVIYSGVDTSSLVPDPERKPQARPQLVSLCRFTPEKNINFVLRLAERCPEFDWVIAGNGPEEANLRRTITEKKLSHVRLAVNIPEEEKVRLYQGSDVFIFPTLHEPLGINIVEAMSCGVPTVAFNSGGARETVMSGETGFLVDTEAEFEDKVRYLATHPAERQQFGVRARARVIENFSLEQMINKTAGLYNQLLEKYGHPFRFNSVTDIKSVS